MAKEIEVQWLPEPEEHNYPAAASYLSLVFEANTVASHVGELRKAPISAFKAKDVFRACTTDW